MPATAVAGRSVITVEGLAHSDLHPVQKAFIAHDAMQCGFCTPGFIVEAGVLLGKLAHRQTRRNALAGRGR